MLGDFWEDCVILRDAVEEVLGLVLWGDNDVLVLLGGGTDLRLGERVLLRGGTCLWECCGICGDTERGLWESGGELLLLSFVSASICVASIGGWFSISDLSICSLNKASFSSANWFVNSSLFCFQPVIPVVKPVAILLFDYHTGLESSEIQILVVEVLAAAQTVVCQPLASARLAVSTQFLRRL